MATSAVVVEGLCKAFPDHKTSVRAVAGVSFTVPAGAFLTLLGPSGCGKTTTLRCIAGLERPDAGTVRIGDQLVSSSGSAVFVPPYRRPIGMVFQSYAVWPHMTVFANVAFPLRSRGCPRSEVGVRVTEALKLVGLGGFEERPATRLSGGQQQRVALARALVAQPQVLLCDEPLSNLDAKLREEMRSELLTLQKKVGITTIYVTHDQQEALAMSDQIAIMKDGKLLEVGTPWDVYYRPGSCFTAEFMGNANQLSGVVAAAARPAADLAEVQTSIGCLICRMPPAAVAGTAVTLYIRPEHVTISFAPLHGDNVLAGTVLASQFLGDQAEYTVGLPGGQLRVRGQPRLEAMTGRGVYCTVSPAAVIVV